MLVRHEAGRLSHPSGRVRGMCKMCEGFSQEQMLADDAAIIAEHGYLVTGVGDGDPPHWTYTVGLLDLVGHPELIVAGPHFEVAGALLNLVGREIVAGRSFGPGDTMDLPDDGSVRFGGVHPIQHRLGTFNVWHALAERGDVRAEQLEVLQVFIPRSRDLPMRTLPATRSVAPREPGRRGATPSPHPSEAATVTYTWSTRKVYHWCMARVRTNIELEDRYVKAIMDRFGVHTKTEAVDLALRHLAGQPMTREEALAMRGAHAIHHLPDDAGPGSILADSSAWIEYDRATGSPVDRRVTALVEGDGKLVVTEPVVMEVLAGARDDRREAELRRLLGRFELLRFDPVIDFDAAARIYRRCRRVGVTPRGMVDCMIASVAVRHEAILLARDVDLVRVAEVVGLTVDDG